MLNNLRDTQPGHAEIQTAEYKAPKHEGATGKNKRDGHQLFVIGFRGLVLFVCSC
jgi:hypothetical protein